MDEGSEAYRPEDVIGVVTSRGWGQEAELLQLPYGSESSEYWEGKRVLSLGAGKKIGDPEKTFPGAEVMALDPSFYTGGSDKYGKLPEEVKKGVVISPEENSADVRVKARAQELPFADNTFDLVSSVLAVPFNVPKMRKADSISESIRVCRTGGEVRLYPVNEDDDLVDMVRNDFGNVEVSQEGPDNKLLIIKKLKS